VTDDMLMVVTPVTPGVARFDDLSPVARIRGGEADHEPVGSMTK
jgi:hypothetical protein